MAEKIQWDFESLGLIPILFDNLKINIKRKLADGI